MSKIIPIFYLPKKYPEDKRILAEGLVANDGQTVKSAVLWLQRKMIAHSGSNKGRPQSPEMIKKYLAGFYVLDLFKANNKFYCDLTPTKTVSLADLDLIEIIQPLHWIIESKSIEFFKERLTQVCSQYSQIVKTYRFDRQILQTQYGITRTPPNYELVRQLLIKHFDYSYIGGTSNNPIYYLEDVYSHKIEIENYLNLMEFIVTNYQEYAKKNMDLVPLSYLIDRLKEDSNYREDEIKKFLIKLRITNRIELRLTKSQLAENLGIELIDINGVKYGFMKILDYTMVV